MPTSFPAGTYGHMIVNTPGIVHYMRMNDSSGSGDDADSLWGSTHSVTTRQSGALVGDDDRSFYFNGSSSYVNYGNNLTLTGKFSLEIWIKPSRLNVDQTFASKENYVGAWSGWTWWLDGSIPVFSRLAGVNTRYSVRGTALAVNQWTHLVVTYDGFTLRQYKNGILVWDTPGGSIYTSGYACILGAATNGQMADRYDSFQGYLDEFAVYNTALSASTISQHYNRALTSPIQHLTLSRSNTGKLSGTAALKSMATTRTTNETVVLRSAESATFFNTQSVGETAVLGATEEAVIETAFGGTILGVSEDVTLGSSEQASIETTIEVAEDAPLFASEEQSLYGQMTVNDTAVLGHEEVATTIKMANLNRDYQTVISRRKGFIHFAAQRLFNGNITVEHEHDQFVPVGTNKPGALGTFALGYSRLGDENETEYAISDLYFLVRNEIGLPLALGMATTDWFEGRITVQFFTDLEEHAIPLRKFGIFPATAG